MATFSAAKRRNVSPTSSILNVVTRDVDASGMPHAPEDGEWIPQDGLPMGDGIVGTNDFWHHGTVGSVVATAANASSIAMVWGSALRTERQALANNRVSVLAHGGIEVKCALYKALDASSLAVDFPVGGLVSLAPNDSVITNASGSEIADRLVLDGMGTDAGWAVGYVIACPEGAPANDKPITVYLYDKPQWIGTVTNA